MEDEEKKEVFCLPRKNMEISIAEASSMFPGFRFSPTDEELICHYLKKKLEGSDTCVEVIPEVDICRDEPWDLPAKSIIQSDTEWFFFSPRGRKYPNGSQSKRATTCGYWKATGKERNVKSGSTVIGTKRTLVFHTGRAPRGQRTEWIMHEYCMSGKSQDLMVVCRLRKNSEFHLDDSPRKKSLEQRHLSAQDNKAAALSGDEQDGIREGTMVAECCSKEGSSSNNSHSVDQNDSGFESDDKMTNEFSHHGSSSLQKEQDSDRNEEDCFADIMKDDIIKLDECSLSASTHIQPMVAAESETKIDESSLIASTHILPMVAGESETMIDESSLIASTHILPMVAGESETMMEESNQPSQVVTAPPLPFQGSANRRLRLRGLKAELQNAETFTTYGLDNITYITELVPGTGSQKSSKNLIGLFSAMAIKHRAILIFLMILLLLFLFVQVCCTLAK